MKASKKWEDYFYSDAQLVCCAVSVKINGVAEFIGSAVYIAPGLFVTAKHVIEDPLTKNGVMKQIHRNKMFGQFDADISTNDFILEVVQLPKIEHKIAQRWNIRWMQFSHDFDFAILTSDFTEGPITKLVPSLPTIPINIHPVQKSNRIISCGFFNDSKPLEVDGVTTHNLNFQGRPGKLKNFHLDVASVAGPAVYEIDNKIEHMMSGGPVFNHEGAVLAVNSAGLYFDDEHSKDRSIATPFIRGMFMKFNFEYRNKTIRTSLIDLAKRGYIQIIGYEHLSQSDKHLVWSPSVNCKYCYGETNKGSCEVTPVKRS